MTPTFSSTFVEHHGIGPCCTLLSCCLPRQPVDRPEALANAADDRNAGPRDVPPARGSSAPGGCATGNAACCSSPRRARTIRGRPTHCSGASKGWPSQLSRQNTTMSWSGLARRREGPAAELTRKVPLPQASRGFPSPLTKPICCSISAFTAADSGGSCRSADAAISRISSANPPDEVTTPTCAPPDVSCSGQQQSPR